MTHASGDGPITFHQLKLIVPFSVSGNSCKTYHFYFNRYLMNPDMELVRCFGVEYDAEQLCEGILKEVKGVSISDN